MFQSFTHVKLSNYALCFLLVFCICITGTTTAQNLVPNDSFETFSSCPPPPGVGNTVDLATPWFQPTAGSSDYFHSCAGAGINGTPANLFGNQAPSSGAGYLGFYAYGPTDLREYISVPLDAALIPGESYCVEFNVSLADLMGFGIEDLGAYFSTTQVSTNNDQVLNVVPQIVNTGGAITDKANWVTISGTFTAGAAHQYLTIGNFSNNVNTTATAVAGGVDPYTSFAYYYIDDVAVTGISTLSVSGNSLLCSGSSTTLTAPAGCQYHSITNSNYNLCVGCINRFLFSKYFSYSNSC